MSYRVLVRVAVRLAIAIQCSLLLGCSTSLLNLNTLDLASTLDELAQRQIVLNLARTKQNPWAVPTQVQLNTGTINARTSVSPALVFPTTATLAAQTTIAATVTKTATKTSPNQNINPTLTAEDVSIWNFAPIQEPEQLKRLQLLYQYGTRNKSPRDFTCEYPIPRKPTTGQSQKSDLEILADALRQAQSGNSPKQKQVGGTRVEPNGKKRDDTLKTVNVYLIEEEYFCTNLALLYKGAKKTTGFTAAAENNPDLAFLTFPTCILCVFGDSVFDNYVKQRVKAGAKIYVSRIGDDVLNLSNAKVKYIRIVLNASLLPDKKFPDNSDDYDTMNDWLYVSLDGLEAVPEEKRAQARFVGAALGYSVYTTNPLKFSEFVVAVREATLQNPQIAKTGSSNPPLVQTVTGQ